MIYLGIDPGLYGALGMIHDSGYAEVYDVPTYKAGKKLKFDERQAKMMVEPLLTQGLMVAIETTYMGYKAAENIGKWKGVIGSMVPYFEPYPVHWQKHCGIYGVKDTDKWKGSRGKEASVRRAQKKWPSLKIQDSEDGKADAMNIADWLKGGR